MVICVKNPTVKNCRILILKYVSLILQQTVDFQRRDYITERNKEVLPLRYPLLAPFLFPPIQKCGYTIWEQIRNSHRDLFPNIDVSFFAIYVLDKPHKH